MPDDPDRSRRRLLRLAGTATAVAVAGCSGGGGDGGDGSGGNGDGGSDGVPSQYETATSLGGTQRDPSGLSSKSAVQYQESPSDGNQCSECTFYIPDKNGDGLGACAIVAGTIQPDGYCVSFSPYEGG